MISLDLGTPSFRAQYVRTCDLLGHVAEHDLELARELLVSVFMFSHAFAVTAASD